MKVAVIGSRTYTDYEEVKRTLKRIPISEIISGGADGADKLGEQYAKENNIPTKIISQQEFISGQEIISRL